MSDKKQILKEGLQGAGKMQPSKLTTRPAPAGEQHGLHGGDRLHAKPKPAPQQPTDNKGK